MSAYRSERFKAAFGKVNALLYEEWAPIGLIGALPREEYETYAMRVISMLADGFSELEIAAYLVKVGGPLASHNISAVSSEVASRLFVLRGEVREIAI